MRIVDKNSVTYFTRNLKDRLLLHRRFSSSQIIRKKKIINLFLITIDDLNNEFAKVIRYFFTY